MSIKYDVHTDRADRHKGDFHIGGWCSYIKSTEDTRTYSGIVRNSEKFKVTNNRMELAAIIKAIEMCNENSDIVLRSDSEYAVNVLNGVDHANVNLDLIKDYNSIIEKKHLHILLRHIDREDNSYVDGIIRYMLDNNEEAKSHEALE